MFGPGWVFRSGGPVESWDSRGPPTGTERPWAMTSRAWSRG